MTRTAHEVKVNKTKCPILSILCRSLPYLNKKCLGIASRGWNLGEKMVRPRVEQKKVVMLHNSKEETAKSFQENQSDMLGKVQIYCFLSCLKPFHTGPGCSEAG